MKILRGAAAWGAFALSMGIIFGGVALLSSQTRDPLFLSVTFALLVVGAGIIMSTLLERL